MWFINKTSKGDIRQMRRLFRTDMHLSNVASHHSIDPFCLIPFFKQSKFHKKAFKIYIFLLFSLLFKCKHANSDTAIQILIHASINMLFRPVHKFLYTYILGIYVYICIHSLFCKILRSWRSTHNKEEEFKIPFPLTTNCSEMKMQCSQNDLKNGGGGWVGASKNFGELAK